MTTPVAFSDAKARIAAVARDPLVPAHPLAVVALAEIERLERAISDGIPKPEGIPPKAWDSLKAMADMHYLYLDDKGTLTPVTEWRKRWREEGARAAAACAHAIQMREALEKIAFITKTERDEAYGLARVMLIADAALAKNPAGEAFKVAFEASLEADGGNVSDLDAEALAAASSLNVKLRVAALEAMSAIGKSLYSTEDRRALDHAHKLLGDALSTPDDALTVPHHVCTPEERERCTHMRCDVRCRAERRKSGEQRTVQQQGKP